MQTRMLLTVCCALALAAVAATTTGNPPDDDARATISTVLMLSDSMDGQSFGPSRVLARRASAPDLERLPDGSIVAIFDYSPVNDERQTVICASTSNDEGASWSPIRRLRISQKGKPVRGQHADIVRVGSTTYLLYFSAESTKGHSVRCAISRGGKDFEVVDARIPIRSWRELHPMAKASSRRLHLLAEVAGASENSFTRSAEPSTVQHLISHNGVTFTKLANERISGASFIGCLLAHAGEVSALVSAADGIREATIDRNRTWQTGSRMLASNGWDSAYIRKAREGALLLYCIPNTAAGDTKGSLVSTQADWSSIDSLSIPNPADKGIGSPDAKGYPDETFLEEDLDVSVDGQLLEDFAPTPDFLNQTHYVDWFLSFSGTSAPDNVADTYASIMSSASNGDSEWPVFSDMVNDGFYSAGNGAIIWTSQDYPHWETSRLQTQHLLDAFREASKQVEYATAANFAPGGEGSDEEPLLIQLQLPSLSKHRTLAKATLANAWRADDSGVVPPQQMTDAIETVLRTADHLHQGATIIEQLVALSEEKLCREMATQALHQGIYDSHDGLRNAYDVLSKYDQQLKDPAKTLPGEHAMTMQIIQHIFSPATPDGEPQLNQERMEELIGLITEDPGAISRLRDLTSDDIYSTIAELDVYFHDVAEKMRVGYPQVRCADIDVLTEQTCEVSPVANIMLPSFGRVHTLFARGETHRRATQLSFAIHLYRSETGRWPKSLDELPEKYGRQCRIDPFTGNSFGYQLDNNAPCIYSLSENAIDDGGIHSQRWNDEAGENESDDFVFWPPQTH